MHPFWGESRARPGPYPRPGGTSMTVSTIAVLLALVGGLLAPTGADAAAPSLEGDLFVVADVGADVRGPHGRLSQQDDLRYSVVTDHEDVLELHAELPDSARTGDRITAS